MNEEIDEVVIPGNGKYNLEIVGESHYVNNFKTIAGTIPEGGLKRKVEARLILEDENPYDKNAVRVEVNGLKVGYLSREIAPIYRQQLIDGGHPRAVGIVQAQIRAYRKGYGLWLDIPVQVVEPATEKNKPCVLFVLPIFVAIIALLILLH